MEAFKEPSKFSVFPEIYSKLMEIASPELKTATKFQAFFHKMVERTKLFLDIKLKKRDENLGKLEEAVVKTPEEIDLEVADMLENEKNDGY